MIAIACDHGGYQYKQMLMQHLADRQLEYKDFGTWSEESCDYPDFALKVCREITEGNVDRGILVCGTGIGMSLAANKVKGIRAALCGDVFSATMSREHNNANVICLGERVLGPGLAVCVLDAWLDTEFAGGRHQRRVDKIMAIEE